MKFVVEFTPEQFAFLDELLGDIVLLYEHQSGALAGLRGEAAHDLAQERLDASQNAAEIAWMLTQCKSEGGASPCRNQ